MKKRRKISVLVVAVLCLVAAAIGFKLIQYANISHNIAVKTEPTEFLQYDEKKTDIESEPPEQVQLNSPDSDDLTQEEGLQNEDFFDEDLSNSDLSEEDLLDVDLLEEDNSNEPPVENPNVAEDTELSDIKPLTGAVIGIDAGHQACGNNELEKSSPGSSSMKAKVTSGTSGVSSKVPEHVVNLDVALLLKERLEGLGAEVMMVREIADVDISNIQRAVMMNERKVDLCIRIHANGSESNNTRGAMMLIPTEMTISGLEDESRRAGEIIFESFLSATGAKDAGIILRGDLTGFNWSEVPVCLIEMGFMTNPEEDLLLVSPEYQSKCADGLANGIISWWTLIN